MTQSVYRFYCPSIQFCIIHWPSNTQKLIMPIHVCSFENKLWYIYDLPCPKYNGNPATALLAFNFCRSCYSWMSVLHYWFKYNNFTILAWWFSNCKNYLDFHSFGFTGVAESEITILMPVTIAIHKPCQLRELFRECLSCTCLSKCLLPDVCDCSVLQTESGRCLASQEQPIAYFFTTFGLVTMKKLNTERWSHLLQ